MAAGRTTLVAGDRPRVRPAMLIVSMGMILNHEKVASMMTLTKHLIIEDQGHFEKEQVQE